MKSIFPNLIFYLLIIFLCGCRSKSVNTFKLIDEIVAQSSKEPELTGLWLDQCSSDTFIFTAQHDFLGTSIEGMWVYFFPDVDRDIVDSLLISEMACDTFYSSEGKIDSINCHPTANYIYQLQYYSQDTIVLNQFINSTGEVTLEKIDNVR